MTTTKWKKSDLQNLIASADQKITFTKKDATERVMIVTKDIPEQKQPKGVATEANQRNDDPPKVQPDTHLTVFDKEKQDWRTIIVENIKEVVEHGG